MIQAWDEPVDGQWRPDMTASTLSEAQAQGDDLRECPPLDGNVEAWIKFLEETARYFENRPTGGEDRAHWANVYNAENCRKIAAALAKGEMTAPVPSDPICTKCASQQEGPVPTECTCELRAPQWEAPPLGALNAIQIILDHMKLAESWDLPTLNRVAESVATVIRDKGETGDTDELVEPVAYRHWLVLSNGIETWQYASDRRVLPDDAEPLVPLSLLTSLRAERDELKSWQRDQVVLIDDTKALISELHADKKALESSLAAEKQRADKYESLYKQAKNNAVFGDLDSGETYAQQMVRLESAEARIRVKDEALAAAPRPNGESARADPVEYMDWFFKVRGAALADQPGAQT